MVTESSGPCLTEHEHPVLSSGSAAEQTASGCKADTDGDLERET